MSGELVVAEVFAGGGARLVFDGAEPARWEDVLAGWGDPGFAARFSAALAGLPAPAFFWETPRLSPERLAAPFECVALPAPALVGPADPRPFAGELAAGAGAAVAFENLGADAELVAPRDLGLGADHAHLAAFLRTAPPVQVAAFWALAAERARAWLAAGRRPWISTSGLGVAWLHLRLDAEPKYYAHAPYRVTD